MDARMQGGKRSVSCADEWRHGGVKRCERPACCRARTNLLPPRPVPCPYLVEVEDGAVVVFLVEHELREHDARLLVFGVMLEQVHAPRLALVHVARREVQPRERQQARRVRVALPQRVVVQLHRLFTLAHRLVVVLREVVADAGRLGALRGQRLWQLATHVGQLLLLQVERALQALAVRVAVAAALVHLGHDEPRIDVQLEVLHTVGVVLRAVCGLGCVRVGRGR
eukprot:365417-Chlamydomonas_euryale.AAC.1